MSPPTSGDENQDNDYGRYMEKKNANKDSRGKLHVWTLLLATIQHGRLICPGQPDPE